MTEARTFKVIVNGVVKSNFKDADTNKRSISAYITDEAACYLEDQIALNGMEWYGDKYPLKEDTDTGKKYIVARSSFEIPVRNLPKGCDIETIGKDSKVKLYCNIKQGEYRRKPYISAYLLGIDVVDLVEKEYYDVFSEAGFTESEAGGDIFPETGTNSENTAG